MAECNFNKSELPVSYVQKMTVRQLNTLCKGFFLLTLTYWSQWKWLLYDIVWDWRDFQRPVPRDTGLSDSQLKEFEMFTPAALCAHTDTYPMKKHSERRKHCACWL